MSIKYAIVKPSKEVLKRGFFVEAVLILNPDNSRTIIFHLLFNQYCDGDKNTRYEWRYEENTLILTQIFEADMVPRCSEPYETFGVIEDVSLDSLNISFFKFEYNNKYLKRMSVSETKSFSKNDNVVTILGIT